MGKKYDAPAAPNYAALLEANEATIAATERMANDYLEFGKEQFQYQKDISDRVIAAQLPAMEAEAAFGIRERERFETQEVPARQAFLDKLRNWDTAQRRETQAAEAVADVRATNEAAREQAEARLQSFGLDPSQVRSTALDNQLRMSQAAQEAMAATGARRQVESQGIQLGAEATNIAAGMPGIIQGAFGTTTGLGGGSVGAGAAPGAGMASVQQIAGQQLLGGANARSQGYGVASNIYGNQVQSAKNASDAKLAQMSMITEGIGAIAGFGIPI